MDSEKEGIATRPASPTQAKAAAVERTGEMEQTSGNSEPNSSNAQLMGLTGNAIGAIKQITIEGLKEAPWWGKAPITVVIAALAAGVAFLVAGASLFALVVVLVGLLSGPVCWFSFQRMFSQKISSSVIAHLKPGAPGATRTWDCELPKLPLPQNSAQDINRSLKEVRNAAARSLDRNKLGGAQPTENVRANIFLANYLEPTDGCAFTLFMPDELRVNMKHPPEWKLRFKPREGMTGLTFAEGQLRVSSQRKEELSDPQKELIHPELRWIISFPLRHPTTRRVVGVLNVDGVKDDYGTDRLSGLADELRTLVDRVAVDLGRTEYVRLRIEYSPSTGAS